MESIDVEGNVIDEIAPNPLIYCTRFLPKVVRKEFPMIDGLELHSTKWEDELQILKNEDLSELNSELLRIRNLFQMKEFISEVDNKIFLEYWKGKEVNELDFNNHLDSIENIIKKAIKQKLEIRIYL